jgi:hypothetical protein
MNTDFFTSIVTLISYHILASKNSDFWPNIKFEETKTIETKIATNVILKDKKL